MLKPSPSKTHTVRQLMQALGETEPGPQRVLRAATMEFSPDILMEVLAAAQVQHAQGLRTLDGSRPRTLGGTFFYLLKQRCTPEQFTRIFVPWSASIIDPQPPASPDPAPPLPLPLLTWDDRTSLDDPEQQKGSVMSARVSIIGQPGAIVERRNVIVLQLVDQRKLSNIPAGMPTPASDPTVYTVYVAPKQWRRVADQVQAGSHQLGIEGWQQVDPQQDGIVVFATKVKAHPLR